MVNWIHFFNELIKNSFKICNKNFILDASNAEKQETKEVTMRNNIYTVRTYCRAKMQISRMKEGCYLFPFQLSTHFTWGKSDNLSKSQLSTQIYGQPQIYTTSICLLMRPLIVYNRHPYFSFNVQSYIHSQYLVVAYAMNKQAAICRNRSR